MGDYESILIVVDMQHDFVDGVLGTPEAKAIVSKIEKKVKSKQYNKVFFTFDSHDNSYLNTMEGKKLPIKHCLVGTHGWSSALDCSFNNNNMVIKQTFGCQDWNYYINDVKRIELCGVCTDICVITNALLLKTKFPEVPIIVDASCCAGTTPEAHKAALAVMKSCQIDVINEG